MEENKIREVIAKDLGLTGELLDEFCKVSKICNYRKNDMAVTQGAVIDSINILVQGLFARYSYSKEGKIVVDGFYSSQGDIIIASYNIDSRAEFYVKAIEESCVVQILVKDLYFILDKFKEAHGIYTRKLMKMLESNSKVRYAFQGYRGKELFEWFIEEYPGLIDRVPHKYIASFLGMTEVHLSRLLNSK